MHWLKRLIRPLLKPVRIGRPVTPPAHARRRTSSPAASRARARRTLQTLQEARAAMAGTFVIADLETTGLSSRDEILELAAIRANAAGRVLGEFSTLVQIRGGLSRQVTELTGITRSMALRRGVPIGQALPTYLLFCGNDPIFFHNAGFDRRFIVQAASWLRLPFENQVLCTLKVARAAWPQLPSHTLKVLAAHVGAPAPTHRGLDDVNASLAVLLAACPALTAQVD